MLWIVVYLLATIVVGFLLQQYFDRETLQKTVADAGLFGVGAFLLIEYLYVIFVPIFNTPIHLAAGYIFGGIEGWIINFVATTAALFTIIWLVKVFGRPLLVRVVSEAVLAKYDNATNKAGPLFLFIVYVAPGFPDDEITYVVAAGQTQFQRFLLPVLLGNIAKTSVSYLGDQGAGGLPMAILSRVVVLAVGLILIGIQERKRFLGPSTTSSPNQAK